MRQNILISYDVNTMSKEGRRRLRKVARACQNYGQRVQFSVFECTVNEMDLERLRQRLLQIVNEEEDSLRIYHLRGSRDEVVESYGRDTYIDFDQPLLA